MSAPERSFLRAHAWQIILALVALGVASERLDNKADRLEVNAIEHRVDDVQRQVPGIARTDSLLREILTVQRQQGVEMRAMRTLICRRETTDSWCGS